MIKIRHESRLVNPKSTPSPAHKMGTVTQETPLRIQLDGDTEELPYTPKKLAGATLALNDRVAIAVYAGNHYLILGAIE